MRLLTGAFLALALVFAGLAGAGEERRLSAAEIKVMLSGKTAIGTGEGEGEGRGYRQYFDPDGSTLYLPDGGRLDSGKWRTDNAKQLYCSWWERVGWSCYDLYETGEGQVLWRSPGGRDFPARLVEGKQLSP